MKQDKPHKNSPHQSAGAQPIRIMGFVDGDVIPAACYDRPYCLEPSKADSEAYDVLRDVMHRSRKVGLAAVIIEKKHALAAVVPIGRTLVLNVLRFATSLVPGAKRVREQSDAVSQRPSPRAQLAAVRQRSGERTMPPAAKSAARIGGTRKHGEVIDLAVRRSTKRATQPRSAKARTRASGVATLHHLRRKSAAQRGPVEIKLA